jgi:hypothetical protein
VDTLYHSNIENRIIEQTKLFGASIAGICNIASLKKSPSHTRSDDFLAGIDDIVVPLEVSPSDMVEKVTWPDDMLSVLVWGIAHEKKQPELDWWSQVPGGTPGNRFLIDISKKMQKWLKDELHLQSRRLH